MAAIRGRMLTDEGATYWLSKDGWNSVESNWLLHGEDPRYQGGIASIGRRKTILPPIAPIDDLAALITRAYESGVLPPFAAPNAVIAWATSKGIRTPAQFVARQHSMTERRKALDAAGSNIQTSAARPATSDSVEAAIDFDMLAGPNRLIAAFNAFTGMNASWFDNLRDRPGLLAARRVAGTGGRNSIRPMFCPYQVMQWLITKPRKGDSRKAMTPETGWRMLKGNFPKVYSEYEIGDPNRDSAV